VPEVTFAGFTKWLKVFEGNGVRVILRVIPNAPVLREIDEIHVTLGTAVAQLVPAHPDRAWVQRRADTARDTLDFRLGQMFAGL
jgi:hypothetical protein